MEGKGTKEGTKGRKTYVLDTSVLLDDPDVIHNLGQSDIVIPTAAIKEMDGFKRSSDPTNWRAKTSRKVARELDRLGCCDDLSRGARTHTGSTVRICPDYEVIDDLASNADNRIVGTAIRLKGQTPGKLVLLTTDRNMRNVARGYGVRAEDYPSYPGDAFDRSKKRLYEYKSPLEDHMEHVARNKETESALEGEDSKRTAVLLAAVFGLVFLLLMLLR